MERVRSRAVARQWALKSPIFRTPDLARRFRDTGLPVLAAHAGYLGDFLFLDTERAELVGLSLWDGEDAQARSRPYLTEAASAVFGVDAAHEIELTTYGVSLSRFHLGPGGRPVVPALESVVVRSVEFQGESMLDPGVHDVLATHMTEYVAEAPGCLGVLMLTDEEEHRLVAESFWTDERSADRTSRSAEETIRSVTASAQATVTMARRLEALVFEPARHPIDRRRPERRGA